MGYQRKRKTYDLRFSEPDMAGCEVRLGAISTGEYLRIKGVDDPSEDDERFMFELLAERLVAWNLEDEHGRPVPCTLASVLDLDLDFVMALVDAWVDAIGGVSDPLPESSPGGGPSPAVSIPMAPLSGNPGPLPEPNGSWGSAVPSTFSRVSS